MEGGGGDGGGCCLLNVPQLDQRRAERGVFLACPSQLGLFLVKVTRQRVFLK